MREVSATGGRYHILLLLADGQVRRTHNVLKRMIDIALTLSATGGRYRICCCSPTARSRS